MTAVMTGSGRVAADGSPVLLAVEDCHVSYGRIPALRGVTIEVGAGEMVALLGANGAGKTTTLRAVSGLIHPNAGAITLDGERIDRLSPPEIVRRGLAHLPEGRDLFGGLSVIENLRYGYWPHRRDRSGYRAQLDEVLDTFPRLRERARQRAATLSGGEQQMLAVGMALMSRPRMLIIDELSLGLAPKVVELLFETLTTVNERGTAILLVEQFIGFALAHTHRAYVLSKGEVVMSRPSAELADDPALLSAYLGDVAPANPATRPREATGATP